MPTGSMSVTVALRLCTPAGKVTCRRKQTRSLTVNGSAGVVDVYVPVDAAQSAELVTGAVVLRGRTDFAICGLFDVIVAFESSTTCWVPVSRAPRWTCRRSRPCS